MSSGGSWPNTALEFAVRRHAPSHVFALFSGGHDSLCSTALAAKHPAFTAAVHINTGIGIAETREFVRATCEKRGWPLIEMHPDAKTYRDLVVEKGMPAGPKAHNTTYYWLKQRQVRRLVAEHKQGRHGRIALVTGIRTQESERRMAAVMSVPVHRIGAQVWVNPILAWSKADCNDFMAAEGLEPNEVVVRCHRSGECLCGALARRSELAEIEFWYPAVAREIRKYEQLAEALGHRDDRWAVRQNVSRDQMRLDHPLCVGCES